MKVYSLFVSAKKFLTEPHAISYVNVLFLEIPPSVELVLNQSD